MIIGATHWVLALGIAFSIHLAGMLWLSFPSPTHETVIEPDSESVVVTLAQNARHAAVDTDSLSAEENPAVDDAPNPVAAPLPETAAPSRPEAETAEPAPDVMDMAAFDTAEPVQPESTREASTPESVEPETVRPARTPEPDPAGDTEAVEPATVTPQVVASQRPADRQSPEPETVAAGGEAEPAAATTAIEAIQPPPVQEAPEQSVGEPDTVATPAQPPVAPGSVVVATDEEEVAVPRRLADAAPVPEPPASSVNVTPAPTSAPPPADPTEVATASVEPSAPTAVPRTKQAAETEVATTVEPAPETAATVEGTETVAAGEAPPTQQSVAVAAAEQPAVTATATRPPSPVASASEPEVREAPEPEVIDLQALQESGGGAGVAARYAGVLKGWLQRNMHYPRAARLSGQEGEVVVRFVIDRDGNVQSIELESKSGFPLLDREAREMIERGDPFPAIPEDMPGRQLEVRVPVNFHVRDKTLTKEIPPIYLE